MAKASVLAVVVFVVAAGCWAQNLVTVQVKGKQKWPFGQVDKIYLSACAAVHWEFRATRPVRPQITLVLGADKDEAIWDRKEIRLTKWSPELFAQGVVILAFEELMPAEEKMAVARRAVNWADSKVESKAFSK